MKDAIMNFELKALDLAQAAAHKGDALVVLVPKGFKAGAGPLAELIACRVSRPATWKPSAASCCRPTRSAAWPAPGWCWSGCEEGTPRQVRQAVAAAVAAVKNGSPAASSSCACR